MKKWVIYTALFGDYDYLKDPDESVEEFDLICFTDQANLKSDVWKVVYVPASDKYSARMNRKYKLLPHLFLRDYEVSIYIDVSIRVLKSPTALVSEILKSNDIILSKHKLRDCIYEEARECVIFRKADYSATVDQIRRYREEGFPRHFGLYENGVLIRRHNSPQLIRLMEQWWEEYNRGSFRDQLSLPYILWKNDISFPISIHSSNDGVYFNLFPHKKEEMDRWEKLQLSLTIRLRRLYYSFFSFG